jgi:hypothetical protein
MRFVLELMIEIMLKKYLMSMDWDEFLKVHNFEIVLDDEFILEDER